MYRGVATARRAENGPTASGETPGVPRNGRRWRAARARLTAGLVRAARFRTRFWRRGLDPQEVYAYLNRVADELDRLTRDVHIAQAEADRVRTALKEWQSRNARQNYYPGAGQGYHAGSAPNRYARNAPNHHAGSAPNHYAGTSNHYAGTSNGRAW